MNPNSKLSAVERELMLRVLLLICGTERRRTICGAIIEASMDGQPSTDATQWAWPTSEGLERRRASHTLRESIMAALNQNGVGTVHTVEEYIVLSGVPLDLRSMWDDAEVRARVRQTRIEFIKHILRSW